MREILFRGQRVDNKELVYGYVFPVVINEVLRYFIIPCDTYCPKHITIKELQVEVIPETIGQFTGLTDKNSKKIFEGDIVKTPYGIGTIYWDDQYLHYYILFDSEDTSGSDTIDIGWSKDLEIIGNIHE